MRIDYFAFAYLEYFREQKSTKKLNCIRLFIVEDVSVDIDITCNYGAPELIPSVGMCSIVVAHLKSFFSICDGCHSGNVTSHHCYCQRKISPFVGMTYNFQPSCGNRPISGITYDFQPSCGENRPICGNSLENLGPFVGSAHLWESAPFVGLTLFVSLTYTSKSG